MSNQELKPCCLDGCKKPAKAKDKYCSMHRARLSRTGRLSKKSIVEKLLELSEPVTESGCWIWTGFCNDDGYGRLRVNGQKTLAHRASYIEHKGEIAKGMQVNHNCDTPCCINPDHLYAGTHQENMDDCMSRGRRKSGKDHHLYNMTGKNHPAHKEYRNGR